MRAINDRVIVEPIDKPKTATTASGIILTEVADDGLKKGIIKYLCDNPSQDLKVGETINFGFGIPFKVEDKEYVVVDIKEILFVD